MILFIFSMCVKNKEIDHTLNSSFDIVFLLFLFIFKILITKKIHIASMKLILINLVALSCTFSNYLWSLIKCEAHVVQQYSSMG